MECGHYRTIALILHASKVLLRIFYCRKDCERYCGWRIGVVLGHVVAPSAELHAVVMLSRSSGGMRRKHWQNKLWKLMGVSLDSCPCVERRRSSMV